MLTLAGPPSPRRRESRGTLGIVQDGAVAVRAGKIIAAGPESEVKRLVNSPRSRRSVLDAGGGVVLPGFVDPHTHLLFAGNRENEMEMRAGGMSYMDILKAGGGILSTVRATRKATKTVLVREAEERLERMLVRGTTTVEVKSGYGLRTEDEVKMLAAARHLGRSQAVEVVPTFLGAHAVPEEFAGRSGDYVRLIMKVMLPAVARGRLARFCDVFCERGAFTLDESRKILRAAKAYGLGLKVHADEFSDTGGAALAADMGAVSAEHLLRSSDGALRALAEAGSIGVLLPSAPLVTTGAWPVASRFYRAGLPVALGTDLSPNAWVESMPLVMAIACHRMGMTPAEALVASTVNAAHAIGMGDRIGSLEPGKQADILIAGVGDYRAIPYRTGVNSITAVVKRGAVAWREAA